MLKMGLFIFAVLMASGCATSSQNGVFKTYFPNGEFQSVQSFKNNRLHGISREFYDSGTLKHAIEYKNDEIDGIYNTYYPSGELWVNEFYEQGNVVGRREFDIEGRLITEEGYGW